MHDARARPRGDVRRSRPSEPLSATTTSPRRPARSIERARLDDARRDRLRLVEAGDHDGDVDASPAATRGAWAVLVIVASSGASRRSQAQDTHAAGEDARGSARESYPSARLRRPRTLDQCYRHARSASSTTAFSRTPSAAPSAGTAARRAARGRRPRGHLPHPAPVGRGERSGHPGVRVVAVGPRRPLYTASGRRRIGAAAALRAGRASGTCCATASRYDAVHTASFPYFSLLGGRRRCGCGARLPLVVDWFELWTRDVLARVPRPCRRADRLRSSSALCVRVPPARASASRGCTRSGCATRACAAPVTVLRGLVRRRAATPTAPGRPSRRGRVRRAPHPREARARWCRPRSPRRARRLPGLRGAILGDGPERDAVLAPRSPSSGSRMWSRRPGFVAARRSTRALRAAACLLLPSRREGYGLVVVEARRAGHAERWSSPAPDNAATELIERASTASSPRPRSGRRSPRCDRARPTTAGARCGAGTATWFARERARAVARGLARAGRRRATRSARS